MSAAPHVDVLLVSDCGDVYGTEQCNHALLLGLRAAGLQVAAAQPGGPNPLVIERRKLGIACHTIAADDPWAAPSDIASLHDHAAYRRLFRDVRPRAVLFSGISPFSLLAGREVAAEVGLPFASIVHLPVVQWKVTADDLQALGARARAVEPMASATVAVSEATLLRLRHDFGLGLVNGRVIPNGRPRSWFEPPAAETRERVRQALGASADTVVFATVGRAERAKGYHLLLPAAERLLRTVDLPPLLFVWIGGGERLSRLRAVVAARGLGDRVRLLGLREDVRDLLVGADAFVLPSLVEGMPLALIEAMAAGLPVVATDVDGIPEVLGSAGVLVPAPDDEAATVDALHDALRTLALADPSARRELGEACRIRAANFTEDSMLRAYTRLVEDELLLLGR
jgi:glycosyltransferase involved in cell wall biosynthesis